MTENFEVSITLRGRDEASRAFAALNRELGRTARDADNAKNKSLGLIGQIGHLNTMVFGAVTAFAGLQLVQVGTDFVNLGRDVTRAKNTFTELAGGTPQAEAALQRLREQTRGVVDDLTLMRGANRLLLMGLAENSDQAAELTGMAVALGTAMGNDAGQAVEDFAALLANRSIPRLDNFGISSARVRERVEELKRAGHDLEEAFTLAVLEEGRLSMDKLGASLDENATAISRLETRWANFTQNVAAGAAQIVDAAATSAEQLAFIYQYNIGQTEQQQQALEANLNAVQGMAAEFQARFGGPFLGIGAYTDEDFAFILREVERLNAELGRVPTLEEVLGTSQIGARFGSEGGFTQYTQDAIRMVVEQQAALVAGREAAELAAQRAAIHAQNEIDLLLQHASAAEEREAAELAAQRAAIHNQNEINLLLQRAVEFEQARADARREARIHAENELAIMQQHAAQFAAARAGRARDALLAEMEAPIGGVPTDAFGDFMLPEYMSQAQADAAVAMFAEQQRRLEELKALAEQMPDVVSDADVQRGEELVRQYESLARDAQAAADALERASLADLFGQTGGGRVGEMSDAVIEAMRERGATDEQIEAAQREFDTASGRETGASLAFQDVLVPQLAEMDPAQAALAMQNFNAVITTLAGMNIDPSTVITAENVGAAAGIGEGGELTAGFDPTAVALSLADAQTAMADINTNAQLVGGYFTTMSGDATIISDSMETTSLQFQTMVGLAPPLVGDTAQLAANFKVSENAIFNMRNTIVELSSKIHTIRLKFDAEAPAWLQSVLGSEMAQVVRSSGGTAPGTDPRGNR